MWAMRAMASRIAVILATWGIVLSAAVADDSPALRVRSVAFSPDGKLLAAGIGDPKKLGGVTIWDFNSKKVWFQHAAKEGISAVAFSPDGQLLAVASYDGSVRVFDVSAKEQRGVLKHAAPVRALAFSADGESLITAGDDKTIRVWNHADGKEVKSYTGPEKPIRCIALSTDGKSMVAGADDAGHVWDSASERSRFQISHDGQGLPAALYLPGSRFFVTGGYDGRVILWDAKEGLRRCAMSGTGGVSSLAYCPKTEMLAVCSWRSVSLRRLPAREANDDERKRVASLLRQLDEDVIERRESACAELLSIGMPAEPMLRQAAKESTSAEVRMRCRKVRDKMLATNDIRLTCDESDIEAAAFSPDGKFVAGAGRDGYVNVWEVATAKRVERLTPAQVR
jgi:WD40 repeat protein